MTFSFFLHRQQLQEDINLQNMDLLGLYLDKYEKLMESIGSEWSLKHMNYHV